MKETVFISAFFDITDILPTRSVKGFIDNASGLLNANVDRVIYTEPHLTDLLRQKASFRERLTIIPYPRSSLYFWKELDKVKKNRENFWPTRDERAPAESHIICCSRQLLILDYIDRYPEIRNICWIDFGKDYLTSNKIEKLTKFPLHEKLRFCICNDIPSHEFRDFQNFFQTYRFRVCGSFISGSTDSWKRSLIEFKRMFFEQLNSQVGHADEQIWNYLIQENSIEYSIYIGDYRDVLDNFMKITQNIQFCQRVIDSIKQNGSLFILKRIEDI